MHARSVQALQGISGFVMSQAYLRFEEVAEIEVDGGQILALNNPRDFFRLGRRPVDLALSQECSAGIEAPGQEDGIEIMLIIFSRNFLGFFELGEGLAGVALNQQSFT